MFLVAAVVIAILAGPSWWGLLLVVLAGLLELAELVVGVRFTRRRRQADIVGRTGVMRADGRVDVRGELWPARGAARPGERVTVVGLYEGTLLVAPE